MNMSEWVPPRCLCPALELQDSLMQWHPKNLPWQSPSGHRRDTPSSIWSQRTSQPPLPTSRRFHPAPCFFPAPGCQVWSHTSKSCLALSLTPTVQHRRSCRPTYFPINQTSRSPSLLPGACITPLHPRQVSSLLPACALSLQPPQEHLGSLH